MTTKGQFIEATADVIKNMNSHVRSGRKHDGGGASWGRGHLGAGPQCTDRCCIFLAASSDTCLDVFSGLGAGLGLGVLAALLGYSLFPNMMLPTRTLVAPTSIYAGHQSLTLFCCC